MHHLLAQAARLAPSRRMAKPARDAHETLLTRLDEAGRIDSERASVASARVAAPKGGSSRGRTRRIAANRERSAILW